MPKKISNKLKVNFDLMSKINKGVFVLNHSKLFSGLMMIMLNVGSKYITVQLSDSQKKILNKYAIFRQILTYERSETKT